MTQHIAPNTSNRYDSVHAYMHQMMKCNNNNDTTLGRYTYVRTPHVYFITKFKNIAQLFFHILLILLFQLNPPPPMPLSNVSLPLHLTPYH